MLLLWLSIIVMIPFDMCRLDGASDGHVADAKTAPITQRIIEFGKVALLDTVFKIIQVKIDLILSIVTYVWHHCFAVIQPFVSLTYLTTSQVIFGL